MPALLGYKNDEKVAIWSCECPLCNVIGDYPIAPKDLHDEYPAYMVNAFKCRGCKKVTLLPELIRMMSNLYCKDTGRTLADFTGSLVSAKEIIDEAYDHRRRIIEGTVQIKVRGWKKK